jgi:hypothetical protein
VQDSAAAVAADLDRLRGVMLQHAGKLAVCLGQGCCASMRFGAIKRAACSSIVANVLI